MWSDGTKIALREKTYLEIIICRHVFVVLCHTSYCQNLGANEQILFDLQLSRGTKKMIQTRKFSSCEKYDISCYIKILGIVC